MPYTSAFNGLGKTPVKVVKKRQCRVNSEENSSNATTVLDSFRRESEYDFKGKTGTVSFKYNEIVAW